MERSSAAIGNQHEVAGIKAARGGYGLDGVGHGGHGDAQDAVGCCRQAHAERLGDMALQGDLGRPDIELHFAAKEAGSADASKHEVGIGDGRLRAAEAIAGRPRVRAGALRTDPQGTILDPGDRAAAGADLENVHHGDLDRQCLLIATDQRRTGRQRLSLMDDAGFGGGAAPDTAPWCR